MQEGAASVAGAESQGLALFSSREKYILYNPKFYSEKIKVAIDADGSDLDVEDILAEEDGIFGFIMLGDKESDCYGASEIHASAAQKGFGPLMYDIAMSNVDALMADRVSVSQSASKVWQVYNNKRPDVEKLPFDDVDNPHTPPKEDDCRVYPDRDELNNAYKLKSSVNVSGLVKNHHSFIEQLQKFLEQKQLTSLKEGDIVQRLTMAGTRFFDKKM